MTQMGLEKWNNLFSLPSISLKICNPQDRIVKIINKPGVSCVG